MLHRPSEERRTVRSTHEAGWTPERIEQLTKLWNDGASASEIARDLGGGVTRNGVIGKVSRLKLPGHGTNAPKRTHREGQGATNKPHGNKNQPKAAGIIARRNSREASRINGKLAHADSAPFRAGAIPEEAEEGVDITKTIGLLQLTDHTCRWPHGDPLQPGFGFCGKPVEATPEGGRQRRYCPMHERRAHVRL